MDRENSIFFSFKIDKSSIHAPLPGGLREYPPPPGGGEIRETYMYVSGRLQICNIKFSFKIKNMDIFIIEQFLIECRFALLRFVIG